METEAQVEIRVENTSNNENVNCDETILNKTIGADNVDIANELVGKVTSDNENLPKHQKITTAECLLDENQLDNMAIIDDDEFTRVEDAKTAIPAREQLIEDCESKKSDRLSDTKDSLSPDDKSKLKSTVVSTSNVEDLSQTEQNCDPSKDVFTNAESTQPTSTDTQQNYSDKTVEESVNNAQSDLIIKIENDSNQTKDFQTATKVSETDSLILTADDELETEMTMTDKNDKPQNEKSAMDNSTCKSLKLSEPVSDDFNEIDVNGGNDRECNLNNDENLTALTNTNRTDFSDDNNDEKISNDSKIIKSDNKSNSKKVGEDSTRKSKTVWISNISSSAKAADLKQFVSKIGKVVTAKVVTDGKSCYGYIVMNSIEAATECVKTLNNDYFESHKICVSFTQPCSDTSNRKSVEREQSKLAKRRESHKLGLIKEGESNKASKRKCSSRTVKRRSKSTSNSWSSRIRRRSSIDPLTTKYKSCRDCHRHSRQKSRSRDRQLREERDRRRYLDEQRRQRDEIRRRIEKEEKQKAMEYKLEQDHKKLQLEIEQFEKERRMEREKIEKERLEILRQKMKLTEECSKIQASSHVKKENYGNTSFDRFKNFERDAPPPPKLSSELKRRSSVFVGAFGGETVPSQIYKPPKRRTSPFSSTFSGIIDEPPKIFKQRKYVNKYKARDCSMSNRQPFPERDIRGEDKILNKAPMSNVPSSYQVKKKIDDLNFQSYLKDFDLNHKSKQSDRKYDCSELKLDVKSERGEAHKIEVIDRKYYVDRNNDDGSRKHRKPDFEDRKPPYTDRKYDYNRDMKRYRSEHYFDREHNPRTDVPPNVNNYNETWKTGLSNPVATTSTGRFEDNNFSSSYLPSRIVPDFYQSSLSTGLGDYRYDHCQQATGRKY